MSQAEIVKSRIIDVDWSPVPTPTKNNGHSNGHSNGHHTAPASSAPPAPPEAVPVEPQTTNGAITSMVLASPVLILEEVDLAKSLDPRLIVLRAPSSEQARSYRLLQHRLAAAANPRVVTVTSAARGEGKTTCAANLALVLAEEAMANVLLIDANLHRPGLADLFGFEPRDGLMSKLLRSEDASPPYAVASLAGNRLHLAALRADTARDKRLDQAILAAAINALRQLYDHIVIDATSVAESADANVASECADATLVCVRAGKSRKSAVRRAIDQLRPATVAGAVLLDT